MDRRRTRSRSPDRRIAVAIFFLHFFVYAYFHQGGGWNQNVRFDQIRAIVERGRLDIGDHLLYSFELGETGATRYRRLVLSDPETRSPRLPLANSLDLTLYAARYYPNKPPGLTFLGVPVYAALHRLERALGLDADDWEVLTANLYLTTVFTVGALAALGAALYFGTSRRLFPELSGAVHLGSALTFALGTLMLPYATLLMDHAVVASLLLLVFRLLIRGIAEEEGGGGTLAVLGAGAVAGMAVLLNNTAVLAVLCLGAWVLWCSRSRLRALWFVVGGLPAAAVLAGYHWVCFGDPLAVPHDHQLAVFRTASTTYFGMFGVPKWSVVLELLFLPYRGLFFSSPVLLLSLYGLYRMAAGRRLRGEAVLFTAIVVAYLLMNASFNGWYGGSSFGPRYLVPALPFLALPLGLAFARFPRVSLGLASASVGTMLLVTSVDPQVEVTLRNPTTQYYLPLALRKTVRIGPFHIRGPVSARPVGAAGGDIEVFDPTTRYAAWNSFNLGEFLFPHRWVSLFPLLFGGGAVAVGLARLARSRDGCAELG